MEKLEIKNLVFENQTLKQTSTFKNSTITYLVLLIAFIAIRISASLGFFSIFGEYADFIASFLIQIVIMLGISVFLFKTLEKKSFKQVFKEFSFKKISLTAIIISIILGVLVFIVNTGVSAFFNSLISIFGYESLPTTSTTDYSIFGFIVSIITTALMPGFCEEVAHRGLLLNGLKNLGMKKAILFSGLLFGLMHLNIEQFFYATLIGWLLGFICIATRSIFPGMIIHFMNNALSVYLSYASHNNWALGDLSSLLNDFLINGNYLYNAFIIFLIISTALFALAWLVYLLIKSTTLKTLENVGTELHQTLEKEQKLKVDMIKLEIPVSKLGFNVKQTFYPTAKQSVFLATAIFLGVLITIFTFIWGVLWQNLWKLPWKKHKKPLKKMKFQSVLL